MVAAQNLTATIKIEAGAKPAAQISGEIAGTTRRNWFFLKNSANADALAARIADFQLFDARKRPLTAKKLADGEYLADAGAVYFQYRIDLTAPSNAAKEAHASWISGEQGILMLDDLLPQTVAENAANAVQIKIVKPEDWRIITAEEKSGDDVFAVEDFTRAIFAIGKNWRETSLNDGKLNLAMTGEWRVTDAEAAQMAAEIFARYARLFGTENSTGKVQILLARMPANVAFGRWEAETLGRTTTVLSADQPFAAQSIQLLHEQLRHEIFHLWIPNRLNLTGNYDWFYEGFTVYQALKNGLRTNQIRFEDFTATLAEAYRLDDFQTPSVSLIEASKNRWRVGNAPVYARGMLVAFLCDAELLQANGGKNTLDEIFREIYRKYGFPNEKADGNAAILEVLNEHRELHPIIEKYITGAEKINLSAALQPFGIKTETENSFLRLRVADKPSGRQKDLLDKLGYNNWRKISRKAK